MDAMVRFLDSLIRRRYRPPGRWRRRLLGGCLLLLGLGLLLRGTAYLVPVRAGDLAQVDQAVEFCDRNRRPLGTLLSQDQERTAVVPLEQVSEHFIHAILAAEDQRFYRHGAVDWRAVVRAGGQSLRAGKIVSGASTVTIQLARMVKPLPRTWPGKLQQVWHAWRIAAGMDKNAILAAYVNRLPMGGNIYGVEAAARAYFGVPAADLTVAQASLLAALPNAPTALNPYTHMEALKQRQRYVLRRMVEDDHLRAPQAERLYRQPVTLQPPDQALPVAPHFLFWLANQLPPDHPPQVVTSLDRDLQRFVAAQVQQAVQGLAQQRVSHAAALVVANATGEVLAYVGSPNYFGLDAGHNDGVQSLRQPGSTLKPFLYQLALERHLIQPSSILQDVPTHYPLPGGQLYSPTDYSETFLGPVRVRADLGNSLELPAVRLLERVGVPGFLGRLVQLGFAHLDQPPEHYGLGLALGSGEVTLWELAQAYWLVARGGNLDGGLSPQRRDVAPQGSDSAASNLAPDSSWALIIDMLADPHARAAAFGVDSVLNLPFPAAVKTGTSSDYRDTWTVGFTTDYTVATWVGNFDGAPMEQVSGVTGAAPLWHRLMVHLHEERAPGGFPPPTGMVKRPICAVTGHRPGPDCPAVVQEYFAPGDLAAYGDAVPVPPSETLQITSPSEGRRYLLFAAPASDDQRLKFAVDNATAPVEWRLNGRSLGTENPLFWPMQPGQWRLEAHSGQGQAQVQFQVMPAAQRPPRRGFSVVGQN